MAEGSSSWAFRGWIGAGLVIALAVAASWLATTWPAEDVTARALQSGPDVRVVDRSDLLAMLPAAGARRTALIFLCGSGVDANAYAALLRPVARAGYPVYVVRMPFRAAPLHAHRPLVFERLRRLIADHPEHARWVLSGHSLGGALAVLFADAEPQALSGLVLVATNYPTEHDLTGLAIPVAQIYATEDGMVALARARAASRLLPPHTRRVEIAGGNHSQFGRYGEQTFDGEATISRERQEALTRAAIIRLLAEAEARR